MFIKYNCRFFKGNIPCQYHKNQDMTCSSCLYYSPKLKKILIIKLLAIGDVLRTTFILDTLKNKFKDSYIVWLTHTQAKPLLVNNPFIDELIENNVDTMNRLRVEKFDVVFNPSNDKESAILATLVRARKKFGFIYNENGYIEPIGKMARYYLEIGINDNLKRQNKLTYQKIVSEMLGIKDCNSRPIIRLTDEELTFANKFKEKYQLNNHLVIGLNTGAGKRWQLKKWPIEKTVELARRISGELKAKVILFGGPEEQERNREIIEKCKDVFIDSGCNNSLREFAKLISLVDILVTSDTLALHIAVALDKYVIGLFGPTSYSEVELYGKGIKIYPKGMDCLSCYKNTCSIKPNCMDKINVDDVFSAIVGFKKSLKC